jgi:folate-dependent phosphoribosylglycinamide formyltransferase PurN
LLVLESAVSNQAVTRFISAHRDDIAMVVVSNPFRRHGGGGPRGVLRHLRNSGLLFSGILAYNFFLYPVLLNIGHGVCAALGIAGARTPIKQHCDNLGVEFLSCDDINDARMIMQLQKRRIDLIVTCFFDQILGHEIIAAAHTACLNVHPGLLPETRGVFPEHHAAAGHGPGFGITIHVIDTPTIDTGRIILRKNLNITGATSMLAVGRSLLEEGLTALAEVLQDLEAGLESATTQGHGIYFSYPTREEIRSLRLAGYELLRVREIYSDVIGIFRAH